MLSAAAPDRVAGGPGLLTTHNDDLIDAIGHHAQPSAISSALGLRLVDYPTLYVAGSVTENPDWMLGSSGSTTTMGDQSMMVQSMSRKLLSGVTEPFVLLKPLRQPPALARRRRPGADRRDRHQVLLQHHHRCRGSAVAHRGRGRPDLGSRRAADLRGRGDPHHRHQGGAHALRRHPVARLRRVRAR